MSSGYRLIITRVTYHHVHDLVLTCSWNSLWGFEIPTNMSWIRLFYFALIWLFFWKTYLHDWWSQQLYCNWMQWQTGWYCWWDKNRTGSFYCFFKQMIHNFCKDDKVKKREMLSSVQCFSNLGLKENIHWSIFYKDRLGTVLHVQHWMAMERVVA